MGHTLIYLLIYTETTININLGTDGTALFLPVCVSGIQFVRYLRNYGLYISDMLLQFLNVRARRLIDAHIKLKSYGVQLIPRGKTAHVEVALLYWRAVGFS